MCNEPLTLSCSLLLAGGCAGRNAFCEEPFVMPIASQWTWNIFWMKFKITRRCRCMLMCPWCCWRMTSNTSNRAVFANPTTWIPVASNCDAVFSRVYSTEVKISLFYREWFLHVTMCSFRRSTWQDDLVATNQLTTMRSCFQYVYTVDAEGKWQNATLYIQQ